VPRVAALQVVALQVAALLVMALQVSALLASALLVAALQAQDWADVYDAHGEGDVVQHVGNDALSPDLVAVVL